MRIKRDSALQSIAVINRCNYRAMCPTQATQQICNIALHYEAEEGSEKPGMSTGFGAEASGSENPGG